METTQKYQRHPLCRCAARNRGMIATGNHYYLDSLRGAPPPKGAARESLSKAPLKGELAGPKGLTEGFRGRQLWFYEISGEFVTCSFRIVRIRLGAFRMVFCVPRLTPPARCAASPFRGGWTRLPDGGAGRLDGTSEPARLTEGVLFDGWQQLKITNCTPFAASRHFPQRGQQRRGAPPPKGAARKAPLSGEVRA